MFYPKSVLRVQDTIKKVPCYFLDHEDIKREKTENRGVNQYLPKGVCQIYNLKSHYEKKNLHLHRSKFKTYLKTEEQRRALVKQYNYVLTEIEYP